MPSLRQLLTAHSPLLLLDAASARVQVGWLRADAAARWSTREEEAGTGLFRAVEELGERPGDCGAFVFCDGPGSVLGARTAAMAVRSWGVVHPRPVFAYHSLAVVAAARPTRDATIIADARRDAWHCVGPDGALRRVPTGELAGTLLLTPDGFRNWTALPAGVSRVPYDLAGLLPAVMDADFFRATDAPDAFLHEEPSYVTWTPQIHRAP